MKIPVTVYEYVTRVDDIPEKRLAMYIEKYGWIIDRGILYKRTVV